MSNSKKANNEADAVRSELRIRVIGVGGAGCSIAERMMRDEEFAGASFAVINTEKVELAKSFAKDKLHLECKMLRGLGTGGDPALGRVAAQEKLEEIQAYCADFDVVFVVAGLGGGAATGAAPIIAKAAKDAGALVVGFAMLPFELEGGRRVKQGRYGLEMLKAAADGVICLPNQKIFKLIDENTSIVETFKRTNGLLIDGIRSLWRLMTRTGLIDIHFSDLCAVVRGRHAESHFASAEAEGANRARKAIDKLLAHPLLDGGRGLDEAGAVLVSLEGGSDMTMADVNAVMKEINRRCEHANVVFGAAVDEQFAERLRITLVVTRRDARDEEEADETHGAAVGGSGVQSEMMDTEFINNKSTPRPKSRLVPPPPEMSEEKKQELMKKSKGMNGAGPQLGKFRQATLPLEIVSKGRFDKTEPTIHNGEDLDVPTYIRRGVGLN